MGVFATFCRLCGLPVQHDHYVESPAMGMLKIYRGGEENGGHTWEADETPFVFGPEHAWLREAVGVLNWGEGERILRGAVSDGALAGPDGEAFVGRGDEEYLAYHQVCWEMAGRPENPAACPQLEGTWMWCQVAPYQGQLFDFVELRADGRDWMVVDPRGDSPQAQRSHTRIERMLGYQPGPPPEESVTEATTVAEILAFDGRWTAQRIPPEPDIDEEDEPLLLAGEPPASSPPSTPQPPADERASVIIIRRRADVIPGIDVSGYPELVWLIKPYDTQAHGLPEPDELAVLDAFDLELKDAVEKDAAAIVVWTQLGVGTSQYAIYARDRQECMERIAALPGFNEPRSAEWDNETDPQWKIYFEEVLGNHPDPWGY